MQNNYIYLDFNATTPLDDEVHKETCSSLKNDWGNPSSDSFYGHKAKSQINLSRQRVAEMTGASPGNVIFTSGGTEGNNMVIYSSVEFFKKHSDLHCKPHIITSSIEHDATLNLVNYLEENDQIELSKIKKFSIHKLAKSIKYNTCLLTVMMANNETGVIFPIQEIGRFLKSLNEKRMKNKLPQIFFHIDAAQAIGKVPVNLKTLQVDYITVVGHKFYGPRIGAICRSETAPLLPMLFGGGQEFGLRPGTENTALIYGLGIACDIVTKKLLDFTKHMTQMRCYLEDKLKEELSDNVIINFIEAEERLPNTVSAQFVGIDGKELLKTCPRVIASTGAACHSTSVSRILCEEIGEEAARSTIRLSLGRGTTKQEIDEAVSLMAQAYRSLKAKD